MDSRRSTAVWFDPLGTWLRCKGFYRRPTGLNDGPLVGYAGTYKGAGGQELHYVGFEYYNFAMVEQYPGALDCFADLLCGELTQSFDVALGAPEGGKALAMAMARQLGCRYAAAEKKVTKVGSQHEREEAELILTRHDINPGDVVLLVEDVCNNFSTTQKMIDLVRERGATVAAVGCALNRSPHPRVPNVPGMIPVYAVIHRELPQYRQDDPLVIKDVAAGNVVWKVKPEWDRLAAAMGAQTNFVQQR